jgi:hypothetical protein
MVEAINMTFQLLVTAQRYPEPSEIAINSNNLMGLTGKSVLGNCGQGWVVKGESLQ